MRCPVCDTDLRVVERQGVEIDVCPRCRGVWLDRGELEKLLDRIDQSDRPERPRRRDDDDDDRDDWRGDRRNGDRRDDSRREDSRRDDAPAQQPPKKKGFWAEWFDFD